MDWSWLKREAAAPGKAVDTVAAELIAALAADLGAPVLTILDRAANTVGDLQAAEIANCRDIETRIANLEGELAHLREQRRQSLVVIDMTRGGLVHLEANATPLDTAKADAGAPVPAVQQTAAPATSAELSAA